MDTIQQLRSYRVHNIALFDLVGSIVGVGWLNERFGTGSFMHGAIAAIPLGIVAHYAWGVPRPLRASSKRTSDSDCLKECVYSSKRRTLRERV